MRRFEEPILVMRPFLPDLAEFREGLEEVWNNRWLTNDGPVVRRFQCALADYLKVPETNLALFVNGTLAFELGCQAMGLVGGEVITTPFTVPVLFETSEMCARVYEEMKTRCNVFTRRRFYPLLTDFAPYRSAQRTCPVAEDVAARILLLPTYHDLPTEDVRDIARDVVDIVKAT